MLHAEVTLPGLTSSVPTARRFVESLLSSWGLPDLGWTAAVCISELAANCALHARTDFTVAVSMEDGRVRLEVTDSSLRIPAPRDYGTDATTGRGLRLLDECTSSWGVEVRNGGKTVWALLEASDDEGLRADTDQDDVSIDALLAAFDDAGGSDGSRPTLSALVPSGPSLLWSIAA